MSTAKRIAGRSLCIPANDRYRSLRGYFRRTTIKDLTNRTKRETPPRAGVPTTTAKSLPYRAQAPHLPARDITLRGARYHSLLPALSSFRARDISVPCEWYHGCSASVDKSGAYLNCATPALLSAPDPAPLRSCSAGGGDNSRIEALYGLLCTHIRLKVLPKRAVFIDPAPAAPCCSTALGALSSLISQTARLRGTRRDLKRISMLKRETDPKGKTIMTCKTLQYMLVFLNDGRTRGRLRIFARHS